MKPFDYKTGMCNRSEFISIGSFLYVLASSGSDVSFMRSSSSEVASFGG